MVGWQSVKNAWPRHAMTYADLVVRLPVIVDYKPGASLAMFGIHKRNRVRALHG